MWTELIQRLAKASISETELDEIATDRQHSLSELCEAVAREVAEGYLSATYSWELCDNAMNNLFASAYAFGDFGLPDYAWRVFEAFDEGEYVHSTNPELDGERRTKALLAKFLTP
jgi:hypothetical protein